MIAVVSALAPALRATRVSPVTGLRDGVVPADHRRAPPAHRRRRRARGCSARRRWRSASSSALSPGEAWVGAGAVGVFLGVALLSPLLVTPVASVVGAPLERFGGVPGRLARENSVRNPGRTASTAAALMVGLALVSFVAVFAAGIKGSIDDAIDKTLIGDLTISNDDGFSDIPIAVRDEVAAIDGVEIASRAAVHRGRGRRRAGHADPDRPGDRGPGAEARLGARARTSCSPTSLRTRR